MNNEGIPASQRVIVVGQGYVGLPLAMRAASVGYDVTGYDIDEAAVRALNRGHTRVEDVPPEELTRLLRSGSYHALSNPSELPDFDIAVITVPTPLKDGVPDLSYIEDSCRTLAPHLRTGATVVLESTTYPGTTEELMVPILEDGSGLRAGSEFFVGYSPERIDPGNTIWNVFNTPKVVSGIDAQSLERVAAFYGTIVSQTISVSSTREAELTKLLENTFRHVNIALVNELAMYASDLGIDVWEAIDAASTKPFGFMRFTPGPGVGGHCLPIDPSYLSWRVKRSLGQTFRFVELANDINDHMPEYVVRRLTHALNRFRKSLNGSRILVLGMSYKKNTADARESPSARVVELLSQFGADVTVADPHTRAQSLPSGVCQIDLTREAVTSADAVLLLVDHDQFDLSMVAEHASYLMDTRRCVAGTNVEYL